MIKTNFWLTNRFDLFFYSLSDILIFIFLFLVSKDFIFRFSISFFLLLFIWIFNSYIFGKYSNNFKKRNIYNLKSLISTICCYAILIFFYFLIDWITNSFIVDRVYKFNLILYSLLFIFVSDLILTSLKFINYKKSKNIDNWLFVEDKKFHDKSFKYFHENHRNFNLDFITFDELDQADFRKYEGLIIYSVDNITKEFIQKLKNIKSSGVLIISLFVFYERYFERIPPELISDKDIISRNFFVPRNSNSIRLKRIGDFFLASFLLILTLPIIIMAGILIKLEDNGPIFYSQKRNGILNIPYNVWKLRTMKVNSEEGGAKWSSKKDPRITFIGRFLRISRVDELPQLISVIKGEMSLIGPRPERPEFDNLLEKKINHYNIRKWIRPGLSGWAQVNLPYTSSIEDSEIKLSYDLFYLRNFSFWLDMLILLKTIKILLHIKGSTPKS